MKIGRVLIWLERKGTIREYFQCRRLRARYGSPKEDTQEGTYWLTIITSWTKMVYDFEDFGFDRYSIGPLQIVISVGKWGKDTISHMPRMTHKELDRLYLEVCGKSFDEV